LTLSTAVLKLPINQLRRVIPWPPLPSSQVKVSASVPFTSSMPLLNVMVLNRNDTRGMKNIEEVYRFFTSPPTKHRGLCIFY
jgi:hypothetical protein